MVPRRGPSRLLDVDVDPLVIARGIGKPVDAVLIDGHPVGVPPGAVRRHRAPHQGSRTRLACDFLRGGHESSDAAGQRSTAGILLACGSDETRSNVSAGGGTHAIVAAFFANLGIAIAKFVGFLITGSASMLAESIHSVADTGNQALLLLGGKRVRARTPTTAPVRLRPRALLLGVRRGARAVQPRARCSPSTRASSKIRHPHELDSRRWSPSASSASASCSRAARSAPPSKEASHAQGRRRAGGTFIRRAKQPELPVVLLEDSGALIGLVLALVAVGDRPRSPTTPVWDGVGTLSIGLLLGVIAVVLADRDEEPAHRRVAPPANVRQAIADAIDDSARRRPAHPPAHPAPRPRGAARRRQGRVRRDRSRSPSWPRRSTRSRRACAPRCPSARPFYLEPDIFRPPLGDASQPPETH